MAEVLQKTDPILSIRRNVLIADDQSINREILGVILKDDYEVLYAEDGRKALEIMRDYGTELSAVLLDLSMPVMDGYEVLKAMQNDAAIDSIPVLVATQRDGDEEEIRALSLGAVDFLTKPYKPEIIKYRVAKTIMLKESRSMLDMVERDSVTGLYTKEFFYSYATRLLRDNPDRQYDLLEVDIDNFKLVNDLYGKDLGDRLLRSLATLMRDRIQELGGLACHVIADDFICIIPHRDDYSEFLKAIFGHMEKDRDIPIVKLRFGIYHVTDPDIPVNIMCDRVTMATDAAKNQYTMPFVFYDDSMREKLMEEQMLTSGMQEAIDTRQFKVYFQAKFDLNCEKPAGAEALVRWIHPKKGFLSPGVFIPLFESNGLIYRLDRYVWEETCRYIHEFKEKYGSCVPVSVNISRIDVYDPKLPQILDELIKKYDVDPKELHLEITESAYTREPEQLIAIVDRLRKSGFYIEMDDFGSGFSSFNMLSKLSVDVLKLDMKFLQEGHFTTEDPGILKYIMEISDWMHVPVVAEGVETAEQVEMLKSLKCEYAQGYYYAKPIPAEEFVKYLNQLK